MVVCQDKPPDLPIPQNENGIMNVTFNPSEADPKKKYYVDSTADTVCKAQSLIVAAAIIPINTRICSPINNTYIPKALNGAIFSHAYCDDPLRTIQDTVVACGIEAAVGLMNSSGHYPYSRPKSQSDFSTSGCVDSLGYRIENTPGRPQACFSLVALHPDKFFAYSGRSSVNVLPFEVMGLKFTQFLMNGQTQPYDITKDLICVEIWDPNAEPPPDYCYQLVYPGFYYRICCCFKETDARLCQIHKSPLNKPAPKNVRCLIGQYDSSKPLKIDYTRMTRKLSQFAAMTEFCLITFELTTTGPQFQYKFLQQSGNENYSDYLRVNFPDGPINETYFSWKDSPENKVYCHFPEPQFNECPQLDKGKLLDSYHMTCVCTFDYCNRDQFYPRLQYLHSNWANRCNGSFIESVRHGNDRCYFYYDPWTGDIFDVLSSSAKRTNRLEETIRTELLFGMTNVLVTVKRREYTLPNECMQPALTVRSFLFLECYPDAFDTPFCGKGHWKIVYPKCRRHRIKAYTFSSVIRFGESGTDVPTNTTGRCYAKAIIQTTATGKEVVLESGALDDLRSVEEMDDCMVSTQNQGQDCASSNPDQDTHLFCCFHTRDVQQYMIQAITPLLRPSDRKDIEPYVQGLEEHWICVLSYLQGNDESQSECIRKDEIAKIMTNPLYEYCRSRQNMRHCGIIGQKYETQIGEFCCCGNTLDDCEMAKIGRNLTAFLSPEIYHQ